MFISTKDLSVPLDKLRSIKCLLGILSRANMKISPTNLFPSNLYAVENPSTVRKT